VNTILTLSRALLSYAAKKLLFSPEDFTPVQVVIPPVSEGQTIRDYLNYVLSVTAWQPYEDEDNDYFSAVLVESVHITTDKANHPIAWITIANIRNRDYKETITLLDFINSFTIGKQTTTITHNA
tara:strand:- start:5452 stop:5826 length:375 start_codon:yes stop_codon:yes gene_type:complete